MMKKLPIIASSMGLADVLQAGLHCRDRKVVEQFEFRLKSIMHSPDLVTTNSGITAFYLILKALKNISNGQKVVLPAYTAGSLVVAVQKAGFTPVLCDISRDDFNMDTRDCLRVISGNTLAVTPVHMFGIAMTDLGILRSRLPAGVYVLEDCCQAMGAMVDHKQVGSFGDISFFSFNRGKNFSSFGGGCICCNHADMVKDIQDIAASLDVPVFVSELGMFFKALFFIFGTNPFVYGLGSGVISRFKENAPPKDLSMKKISPFQSASGLRNLVRIEDIFNKRQEHGIMVFEGLRNAQGILLPKISSLTKPVFNRLPLLFEDTNRLSSIQKKLWAQGIETSRMYLRPLHHMFKLGYAKSDFPNAVYVASHLLTLPVHSGLSYTDIQRMIDVIKG